MGGDRELRERVKREEQAHSEDDVLARSYELKNRFSHIWGYPSRQRLGKKIQEICLDIEDQIVLDYGCGRGESSLSYLAAGAVVYGVDISANYIGEARAKAEEVGFSPERFDFRVMDAHSLDFLDATFDLVVGEGILHHLSWEVALKEICRVLKPGGRVLLLEPLADNPLLKLFRIATPNARTVDETPFTGKDLKRLFSVGAWRSETIYCGIIEAPVAMVTSILFPRRPDNMVLNVADGIERWIHARGLMSSWNQYVLFNLVKQ